MFRYRSTIVWAIVFAFISAAGLGVGLVSLGPVVAEIANPDAANSLRAQAIEFNAADHFLSVPDWLVGILPTDPFNGVLFMMAFLAILTVIGGLANFLHLYLSKLVIIRTIANIRQDAFDKVIAMPLGRIISRGPSEFIARLIRDSTALQVGFNSLLSRALAQVTKGVAALVAAIIIDFRLVLVVIVVGPFLMYFLRKIGKRIRRGTRGSLEAQEDLLRVASESLQGMRAVKANTAEARSSEQFNSGNLRVVKNESKVALMRALSSPVVECLSVFVVGVLAIIAASQIINGTLDFDRFLLGIATIAIAGASFRPLAGLVNEIQAASAPAKRLQDMLSEPAEVAPGTKLPVLARHSQSIQFSDISLTYAGADRAALEQVSVRIQFGQRVAIVGPNGSGKTTLVSLLPRLILPDTGVISIDGTDVAQIDLKSLRSQIGVVTQETVLFRGSVAENICFGRENTTRQEIIAAAQRAHADEFIEQLPGQYDADLAEQGASLSGGQRQRLAIARAILRDPSILILDEATSQIDAHSEAMINEALSEFCQGRTSLVIAHRLSTVLNADSIIVLDDGRLLDQGSHDELLARCSTYNRLSHTQLQTTT